jgi:hypothetical protein
MLRRNYIVLIVLSVIVTIVASMCGLGRSIPDATATENRIGPVLQEETVPSESQSGVTASVVQQIQTATEVAPQESATPTKTFLPLVSTSSLPTSDGSWPMAGANPQRTSWSSEEVLGDLRAVWYRPIEPFIPHRVQIIAAYDNIYLSTASGLYAFDAVTGAEKWVYPTEFPLGHSPTIYEGVAYVGGFDHKLHAIDALTGQGLWTFEGGAGFDSNPLVVGNKVYAGNRDGFLYAVNISGSAVGQLAWKFETGGPIHFSAAYKDGVLFFASNDSYAYALNASDGSLLWKSKKLPGAGFHSWWPVVYQNYVIFAGSSNYRFGSEVGPGSLPKFEMEEVFPNFKSDPRGTLIGQLGAQPGSWASGTPTINMSQPNITPNGSTLSITEYYEQKPWRRTYLILNRFSGQEYTTDFDSDGKPEYAPILFLGANGSGNRYPPVVGSDNVLYQTNLYMSDPAIAGGQITGWQIGTPYISIISMDWGAVDEPHAYAAGGNLIYWNLCCDRQSGSIDISIPNTDFASNVLNSVDPPTGPADRDREYHFSNGPDTIPGYAVGYYGSDKSPFASFGGQNGVYGYHGDVSAPIPYKGMVFMHRSNALIAMADAPAGTATALPMAQTVEVNKNAPTISDDLLKGRLTGEVQKILAAGHLRPGYLNSGIFDFRARFECGDFLSDYFHSTGDVIYFLARALPYLDPALQEQTKAYIKSEFEAFPPYQYNHNGWQSGAAREVFDLPPETAAAMASSPPKNANTNFLGWDFAPHTFYALWKYAELFGGAGAIFEASKGKLPPLPNETYLLDMPHVQNAFIAGYIGYLNLEEMAGNSPSTSVQSDLDYLINLRKTTFSKDTSSLYLNNFDMYYCRTLNVSRNFMFMVPELAQILREDPGVLSKIQEAISEYERIAPYWFVSKSETTFGEGILVPAFDYHSMFQAKAQILQEPGSELTQYIDIPTFPVGDLFYIDNLVSAIEADS